MPARAGRRAEWPSWTDPLLVERLRLAGVERPWEHQVQAAELAHGGSSVVVATGTASGKSLAYLLPVLTDLLGDDRAAALYLAPTKALATDQLRAVRALNLMAVRAATYDGDTPREERDWVRRHGRLVLTNPDMLHRGDPAAARRLGVVPALAEVRRRRRVPHLPGRVRLARRAGAAPAAAAVREVRRLPRLRPGQRDGARPGGRRRRG